MKPTEWLGSIELNKAMIICGHPGLWFRRYEVQIENPGLYNVFCDSVLIENSCTSYESISEVAIVKTNKETYGYGSVIMEDVSTGNHGGILLCDKDQFSSLPKVIDDDEGLWNFFADGLCSEKSSNHDKWRSNSVNCNVIFIPSQEYYRVYRESDGCGYIIRCDVFDDEVVVEF